MKIGITIPDYYKSFLEETAKMNGMTVTKVCSVIVANYLSYNKQKSRIPIFAPTYNVMYANKKTKKIVDEDDNEIYAQYENKTIDDILGPENEPEEKDPNEIPF